MKNTVMMAEMSWVDYEERLKAGQVLMLPCGTIEQHGYHLPLGVDKLLPTSVCRDVAEVIGAIVADPIVYGAKSQPRMGGGQGYIGTTSLDATTYCYVIRDILREFIRHGARKICVVNGHYENMMLTMEGIDLAMREAKFDGIDDLKIMRLEYWDYVRDETLDKVFPNGFPGIELEHAAVLETSLMMHYHPHLVEPELIPEEQPAEFPHYDIYPQSKKWVPTSGCLAPAVGSSAEKGAMLANDSVEGMCRDIRAEFND